MAKLLKVQLQDAEGNTYYLQTDGNSVFLEDGRTVEVALEAKLETTALSNQQVNSTSKVPTSALAYAMQQAITQNQTDISELNAKTSFSSIQGVGNKITIPTDIYNTYTVFGVNIRVDGSGQQVQTVLKNFEFTWSVDTGISDFYAKGNGSWNGNIITITKSAGKDITSVYAFPIK